MAVLMMKRLSIRYIIVSLLLIIFIPFALVSYTVIDGMVKLQIENARQESRKLNNSAFDEFISLQFEQQVLFAEEIVFLSDLEQLSPTESALLLDASLPRLQSNFPLFGGYLIGPHGQKLPYGEETEVDTSSTYEALVQSQVPQQDVYCDKECFLNVTIPLIMNDIQWGLLLSVDLTDSLIQFSRLRNIDLGLLMDSSANSLYTRSWQGRAIPILTNSEVTQAVLNHIHQPIGELFKEGVVAENSNNHYFVWGHGYQQDSNTHFRVIFFEDYTSQKQAQKKRTYTALGLMLLILAALFISLLLITSNPVRRLRGLTKAVYQIGNKDYSSASATLGSKVTASYFHDEIYTVQEALKVSISNLEQYEIKLKESNSHLEYISSHDHITGLLNRYALSQDMKLIAENATTLRTLLLLDIKGFNEINDNLGHSVGDRLLKEVGFHLKQILPNDIQVYRYGGDEFMLLCHSSEIFNEPELLIKKLQHMMAHDFHSQFLSLPISFTCGIAKGISDSPDFEKLPLQADMALHEAKYHSHSGYEIYTPKMEERLTHTFQIRSHFEAALKSNEFFLTYQPLIRFYDAKLIKMEALVRWNSKELGYVFPDQFITILEETGQIELLTDWLVVEAATTVKQLDDMGLDSTVISINISGVQVSDCTYIDRIVALLEQESVSPLRIELEITETSLVRDFEQARKWVETAKSHGFKVAMDDFGTGYSSLSYLTSISFDTIKLDRSLIDDIVTNTVQQNVVTSVVRMIHDLGMNIVVEGIEDNEQFQFLKALNCNIAQGYFISRPLEKDILFERLDNYKAIRTWFSE